MAYHQASQRPPAHYRQFQSSSPPQHQPPPTAPVQDPALRLSSGFRPGEDGLYTRQNASAAHHARYPGSTGSTGYQNDPGVTLPDTSFPPRTAPHAGSTNTSAYQPYSHGPAPSAPPLYNPQQYGAPQPAAHPEYTPQPNNFNAGSFTSNYQSYNPAAYYRPSQLDQSGGVAQATRVHAPPPPPQRYYGQSYVDRVSPASASSARFSNPSPTLPYRNPPPQPCENNQGATSNNAHTPPAPPPPPFSPGRVAFPFHTPSSSTSSRQQTYPSPRDGRRISADSQTINNRPLPTLQHLPSLQSQHFPSPSVHRRPVGGHPSLPQTPGTPGPTPPAHSPQRTDTLGRHPQARPLPGPPPAQEDYFGKGNDYDGGHSEERAYEDLMQEVEAAVMGKPAPSRRLRENSRPLPPPPEEESRGYQALDRNQSSFPTNGNFLEPPEGGIDTDSDAEAEAGLAAIRSAEEQDAADAARRQSGAPSNRGTQSSLMPPDPYESPASSDSGVQFDMTSYGGGFSPPYQHSGQRMSNAYGTGQPFAAMRGSNRSGLSTASTDVGGGGYDYPDPAQEYPQPHSFAPARVDSGGTGGLSDPNARLRRLSFEDGDEAALVDTDTSYTSGTTSPSRDGLPEIFFHPSSAAGRLLPVAPMDQTIPQLMPAGTYKESEKLLQYDESGRPRFPLSPEVYAQTMTATGTPVPRSSSLMSHASQPQAIQPIRSKTDADRARILKQQQQSGLRSASSYGTDAFGDAAVNSGAEVLDLPSIPASKRRKFNPAKLSTAEFQNCSEPWALSSIVGWLKDMTDCEADLKESAVIDGIVALFTHKVPTMNTADAETLGAKVVRAMFHAGTLIKDEEWVRFGSAAVSGVLFQLTGSGCYSSRVHTDPLPGRCYSHHCMRTLKKINLQTDGLPLQKKTEDWVTFYSIKNEDIENVDKKDVERQNNLHEIVTSEDFYMDQLNVIKVLYREELAKWDPPILPPTRRDKFLNDVFGNIDAVKQANEEFLLPQLKYRQQEQGPWIQGFSDIFREWIRKARAAYIDYAAGLPNAIYLVRQEKNRNLLFRQFLDHMQSHERSKRLDWQNFIKAPVTRLQRYGLLLDTVHKHMKKESQEKTNLAAAIEEIKAVTMECNLKVDEMDKRVSMKELQTKLKLRSGMDNVQLNLTHLGREVLYRGDIQRLGQTKISWVESHAILFDHYFVLAKAVEERHPAGGEKSERYDVSKLPIPMDLLVLESTNDDPVTKATMKGLGGVANRAAIQPEYRAGKPSVSNGTSSPGLSHVDTSSSTASANNRAMGANTTTDLAREEKLLYPFRIRHLGKVDSYVLYVSSKTIRREWCSKIIEAKTRHAASLFKQDAEPFRLRVIADTAFAHDALSSGPGIIIRGTPLDRAIQDLEKAFDRTGPKPMPVCRAAVHCATAFTHPNGTKMLAIGTDYGVYLTDNHNPRGWTRSIDSTRVTQIAVLEEFSLFLLLTQKQLVAHHLDTVLHPTTSSSGSSIANNTSASYPLRAPQKLSGARDIGFFAHGRMKDRELIFYKKREGVTSVFKVLEPIFQRTGSISSTSSTSSMRSRLMSGMRMKSGGIGTEAFRDFDDFYIGSETYAINLFHSSLAISTIRGIEVMTLDKKTPISIPDLKAPDVKSIADRIRDQKPLGMFRLSDSEFLLAYEEVGVYVNKHGDVSRSVIMEYIGRAKQACLVSSLYLILVDSHGLYVEVRNAINGRLRQVISGRDVKLLDDGAGGGSVAPRGKGHERGTVKICMQHPESERSQLVLEMDMNEGLKE